MPEQEPESVNEHFIAFNGRVAGRRSIILYGALSQRTNSHRPMIIVISQGSHYTSLIGEIPPITGGNGYFSSIDLRLARRYWVGGARRSFLTASCPLPTGVNIGEFKFARFTEEFEGGVKATKELSSTCIARGR